MKVGVLVKYCTECGAELVDKYLENEGVVPFCKNCNQFRFPMYNVAVSIICIDAVKNKILLIKQYGKDDFILIAGYVNKGENAENAVARELMEETGLKAEKITYNRSSYFEPSNTLMLNFSCVISSDSVLNTNDEIDFCQWFDFDSARKNIKPNCLAQEFLDSYLDKL
jgi:NAD+ diphosphatase